MASMTELLSLIKPAWIEATEQRCPGATFHVLLPVRKEPPEDKLANLFRFVDNARTEKSAQ